MQNLDTFQYIIVPHQTMCHVIKQFRQNVLNNLKKKL